MIQFSDHFTYRKLLRYTFSPIIMMVFTSIYGVVDGLFVSNFVGKTAFAAVNFIYPFLLIFGCFGFMFGSGGNAYIAKTLGEKKEEKANEIFSSLVFLSFFCGILLSTIAFLLLRPASIFLGAKGELLDNAILYGSIYILGIPATMIQYEFQSLYATANKPKLGLFATVISGLSNILLDALFIAGFSWGISGAAFATILSQWIGAILPLIYFGRKNSSLLRIQKTKIDWASFFRICGNGISEVVNNLSYSLVSMLYNSQLLKYAGESGVASFGILMYISFLFTSIFWGYVVGVSPLISYQYGSGNHKELKNLSRKSIVIILIFSLTMFTISEVFAKPISMLFAGYDLDLYKMTLRGFFIFSFAFLFAGIAIHASSFFTALNNGILSALVSFTRVFLFQIPAILLLPLLWDLDGIWISLVVADFLTCIFGGILIFVKRKVYHY